MLHIGGTHEQLPDDVAYQRQYVQHHGGLDECVSGRFVETGDNEVGHYRSGEEQQGGEPSLLAVKPSGLYAPLGGVASVAPLEESYELHWYEV